MSLTYIPVQSMGILKAEQGTQDDGRRGARSLASRVGRAR